MQAILEELAGSLTDFLIYAAMAAVILVGLFKCVFPMTHAAGHLRRGIRKLESAAGEVRPVWQDVLFLGKQMQHPWRRFLVNAEVKLRKLPKQRRLFFQQRRSDERFRFRQFLSAASNADYGIDSAPVLRQRFIRDAPARLRQTAAHFFRRDIRLHDDFRAVEPTLAHFQNPRDGFAAHTGDDRRVHRLVNRLRAVADAETNAAAHPCERNDLPRAIQRRRRNIRQQNPLTAPVLQ